MLGDVIFSGFWVNVKSVPSTIMPQLGKVYLVFLNNNSSSLFASDCTKCTHFMDCMIALMYQLMWLSLKPEPMWKWFLVLAGLAYVFVHQDSWEMSSVNIPQDCLQDLFFKGGNWMTFNFLDNGFEGFSCHSVLLDLATAVAH
jgi:hypothetical protein